MYSAQIYSSSSSGMSDTIKLAIANSLSIVNFTNCENILRKVYHIPDSESLLFYKIDYNSEIDSKVNNKTDGSNSISYNVFDKSGNQLNLTYCQNTTIKINVPVSGIGNSSAVNTSMFSEYNNSGIDIYDKNNTFYNDICDVYSSNGTDLTLNDRRSSIYPNVSIQCSEGCEYTGIDENNYVNCNCTVVAKSETTVDVISDLLSVLTQSNFIVVGCYKNAINPVYIFLT